MIDPNENPAALHRNGDGTHEPPGLEDEIADRVLTRLAAMANGPRQLTAPETDAPAPPSGAVLHPPADPASRQWFLMQLWSEFRLAVRMYFDPRYRVSRTVQFLLPLVLALFVLNYLLFGVWFDIPILSPILERVGGVLLAVFLYKVLTRELVRYRDVLEYLTRYGSR